MFFDPVAPARLMRRFSQLAFPPELPVGSRSRHSPSSRLALRANLRLLHLALPLMLGCVLGGQIQADTVETEGRAAGDQKTAHEQVLADALLGGTVFSVDCQTQLCGDRNFIITTPLMISVIPRILGASSF